METVKLTPKAKEALMAVENALTSFLNEAGLNDEPETSTGVDKPDPEEPALRKGSMNRKDCVGNGVIIGGDNTVLNSFLSLVDTIKSGVCSYSEKEGFQVELQFKEPRFGYSGEPPKTIKFSLESYPKGNPTKTEAAGKPEGVRVSMDRAVKGTGCPVE